MQQAWPEIWSIHRLDTKVTTLLGEIATSSSVLEGLQDHRFADFVYHGNSVPEKPSEAPFGLYGSNRLTLFDVVRSRPPAAELTEGNIADEGLHLTAAAQYCGFRCSLAIDRVFLVTRDPQEQLEMLSSL